MKKRHDMASGVKDWVLHDLRRTVATGMAALGVAPHVADKILNHQSGAISGIVAVYQRHEFMAERKAAIELWSEPRGNYDRFADRAGDSNSQSFSYELARTMT